MTHPHPRHTPTPSGRTDSTRPPRTRHNSPDHQPYPSAPAPTTTHRPRTRRIPTAPRPRTTTPIPATVWTCGPTPIDPHSRWPTPLVTTIVTSFSKPGEQVVILPWPTTPAADHTMIGHTGTPEPDTELATALTAITDLGRTVHLARLEPPPTPHGPASRPFWADLLHDPDNTRAPHPDERHPHPPNTTPHQLDLKTKDTDMIITSLRPEHNRAARASDHLRDHVALLAARLLRPRGILVVLTHSDWSHGELIDPTGPVVASAQHADLLYLQHIIALHTPIHGGEFLGQPPSPTATDTARSQHHAQPHHRISSDILVFTQPRDHQPPPLTTAATLATAVTP